MIYKTIYLKDEYEFLGEDGRNPKVDIYLPSNLTELKREEQKRPSIVICPGGAYLMCSQIEAEPVAFHFLPEGYNVFVLTYSVTPHCYPTQLIEVAAVFDLIKRNAGKWNCDLNRTALMGFSAGGHLAAHYTNVCELPEVRKVFPESKRPKASVLCYPVISANSAIAHKKSFSFLLGHEPSPDEKVRFSCENMVSANTPPTFIWHTSKDENVAVENSLVYAMALSKFGIPYEMHIYPFGRHGIATADYNTNNHLDPEVARNHIWLTAVKNWLDLTFNNQ